MTRVLPRNLWRPDVQKRRAVKPMAFPEAGIASARSRLTGLRDELSQLLDDDDERWYVFGFSKSTWRLSNNE
jgi:hypothetical protein